MFGNVGQDSKASGKKSQEPKQSRKGPKPAAREKVDESFFQGSSVDGDDLLMETISRPVAGKSLSQSSVTKPIPSMKGGWSDGRDELEDGDVDRRLRASTFQERDGDSDNDIPMIPELEDTQAPGSTQEVTQAPLVAVNRVTTYKELDSDLMKHVAFLTLDNEIDLKLLGKALCPEPDLVEEDVPWEWDQLFTEVTSELTREWDSDDIFADKSTSTITA